jgi:hypothetical protein
MWRSGFETVEGTEATREDEEKGVPQHFGSLAQAVSAPRRDGHDTWRMNMNMSEKKGEVVEKVEDVGEKV